MSSLSSLLHIKNGIFQSQFYHQNFELDHWLANYTLFIMQVKSRVKFHKMPFNSHLISNDIYIAYFKYMLTNTEYYFKYLFLSYHFIISISFYYIKNEFSLNTGNYSSMLINAFNKVSIAILLYSLSSVLIAVHIEKLTCRGRMHTRV